MHENACPFEDYLFSPLIQQGERFSTCNSTRGTNRNLSFQIVFTAAGIFAGSVTYRVRRINPATGEFILATTTADVFTGPTIEGINFGPIVTIAGGFSSLELRSGLAGDMEQVSLRVWEQPTPTQDRNNSNVRNQSGGFCYSSNEQVVRF